MNLIPLNMCMLKTAITWLGSALMRHRLDTGVITLNNGEHSIFVPTPRIQWPHNVWLMLHDGDIATCIGDVSWATAIPGEGGFNLFANIKTVSCKVHWRATSTRRGQKDS